jgi:hypothetical protein
MADMCAVHDAPRLIVLEHRVGDLFNAAQCALDLTMAARYEWHGKSQDARSAVRAARRALSAI